MDRPEDVKKVALALAGILVLGLALSVLFILPQVAASRQEADASLSSTRLKSLARSLLVYAEENNDRLPPSDRWMESLPVAESSPSTLESPFVSEGFALNEPVGGVPLARVKEANDVPLLFESTKRVLNSAGGREILSGRKDAAAILADETLSRRPQTLNWTFSPES